MMVIRVFTFALIMASVGAHAASEQPATHAWYQAKLITTAVTAACADTNNLVGDTEDGSLYLASSGQAGSRLYLFNMNTGSSPSVAMSRIILPALPTIDGHTSSGAYSETNIESPGGSLGTLSLTVSWGDQNAFQLQIVHTAENSSCTITDLVALLHSGR